MQKVLACHVAINAAYRIEVYKSGHHFEYLTINSDNEIVNLGLGFTTEEDALGWGCYALLNFVGLAEVQDFRE